MAAEDEGKTYQYILSVMDIFSRFHCLAPLTTEKSSDVKKELQKIYEIHGIPKYLQSDNGGEDILQNK